MYSGKVSGPRSKRLVKGGVSITDIQLSAALIWLRPKKGFKSCGCPPGFHPSVPIPILVPLPYSSSFPLLRTFDCLQVHRLADQQGQNEDSTLVIPYQPPGSGLLLPDMSGRISLLLLIIPIESKSRLVIARPCLTTDHRPWIPRSLVRTNNTEIHLTPSTLVSLPRREKGIKVTSKLSPSVNLR